MGRRLSEGKRRKSPVTRTGPFGVSIKLEGGINSPILGVPEKREETKREREKKENKKGGPPLRERRDGKGPGEKYRSKRVKKNREAKNKPKD